MQPTGNGWLLFKEWKHHSSADFSEYLVKKVGQVELKKIKKLEEKGRKIIRDMLIAVRKVLHEVQFFFFKWINT